MTRTTPIADRSRPRLPHVPLFLLIMVIAQLSGCEHAVDPKPTSGELIRQVLTTGADESLLFSAAVLSNQTGTIAFSRTIDSIHRGFVNRYFYSDTIEVPLAEAFESDINDTLWGRLTFNVEGVTVTRKYINNSFGGHAKLLDNACFTCENPWRIWRMEQRHARQPNSFGDPLIRFFTITGPGGLFVVDSSARVRTNRDSVVTVAIDSVVQLTIRVESDTPDDTFFVTYPVSGGYLTQALAHNAVDSLGHTGVVGVRSGRRFELLAVQGFKRQALRDTLFSQATASAVQTAIIAFR